MLSKTAPPACSSRSWVANTPSAAALATFCRAANAGLIANWNEVCCEAGSTEGAEVESKCADCNGTPDISAIKTSALRDGIAFNASGTLEVAGQAGAVGLAANAAWSDPTTVKTLDRSPIASAYPAAPAA